ncbi:MAG: hypothetical protein PHW96_00610 [Candidatus Nanoarchaeia archaeon]|nr:hypothetical protein [Candidatus Nanoarchaeia archaeon]
MKYVKPAVSVKKKESSDNVNFYEDVVLSRLSPAGIFDYHLENALIDSFMMVVQKVKEKHNIDDFEFEYNYRENKDNFREFVKKNVIKFLDTDFFDKEFAFSISRETLEGIVIDFCDSQCGLSNVFNPLFHNAVSLENECEQNHSKILEILYGGRGKSENNNAY